MSHSVGAETFGKELELLKEIAPEVHRVAVLSDPTHPSHAPAISNVKVAAQALKVELQLLEARGSNEFDGAFSAMSKERVGALLVLPGPAFNLHRTRLVDLAAKNRLPSMYGFREYVRAGGLISYGPNLPDLFRRSANFVDKILRGAKPADRRAHFGRKSERIDDAQLALALEDLEAALARDEAKDEKTDDLPVQQPTKFELTVNLKTARTLGLTVPPALLTRADEVIE